MASVTAGVPAGRGARTGRLPHARPGVPGGPGRGPPGPGTRAAAGRGAPGRGPHPRRRHGRARRTAGFAAAGGAAPYPDDDAPASFMEPAGMNLAKGLQARQAVDPNFLFKLLAEVTLDQGIAVVTNVFTFGAYWTWSAATAASACLLHGTAFINDILLVWCLAPTPLACSTKEEEGCGVLAHCFQEGEGVTLKDRALCWFNKFKLYAVLGGIAALVSDALIVLIVGNTKLTLGRLKTATICGALHLGISANTRYQIVNGIELLIEKTMPAAFIKPGTVAVRLANQFAGAKLFLLLSFFVFKYF